MIVIVECECGLKRTFRFGDHCNGASWDCACGRLLTIATNNSRPETAWAPATPIPAGTPMKMPNGETRFASESGQTSEGEALMEFFKK